jgi:hypothetical protein
MVEKPTAAFVLSLMGGIFYILGGLVVALVGAFIGGLAGVLGGAGIGVGIFALSTIGLVSGIIMIIGAALLNSSDVGRVRTGSVLVLVFAIIGAIFTFLGLVIGFILALIGSILGLVWKPSPPFMRPPVPPPP